MYVQWRSRKRDPLTTNHIIRNYKGTLAITTLCGYEFNPLEVDWHTLIGSHEKHNFGPVCGKCIYVENANGR